MAVETQLASSISEFSPHIAKKYYHGDAYLPRGVRGQSEFSLKSVQAGAMPVALFDGASMGLRRTWQHIRENSCGAYVLWFPLTGSITVTQDLAHGVSASAGELLITCGDRPFHVQAHAEAEGKCSQLHVIVPSHILRSQLPGIDRICGRNFRVTSGGGLIASQMFRAMISESDECSADCLGTLGRAALEAACETIRNETAEMPVQVDTKLAHIERVLRFIDRHLATQGLTADMVAEACNISRRYLHYLLRNADTSFSEYLWHARLQQAREWLADPEFAHFHIVDIGYMCGFRSASHFSNSYRTRYGHAPRDARALGQSADGEGSETRVH